MPSKTDLPLSLTLHPSFSGISQPASGAATVLWRHWRSMDPARGRLNFRTRHLQLQIQGSSLGFLGEKKKEPNTHRALKTYLVFRFFGSDFFLGVKNMFETWSWKRSFFTRWKKNREGYQCCNSICKVGEIFQLTSATKHPCASPERCRKCPTLTESPKYSVKLCQISIPSSRTTPPVRKCVLCQSDLTSNEHFQNCKPSLSIHDAEQQAGNYTAATTPSISELLVPTTQSRTGLGPLNSNRCHRLPMMLRNNAYHIVLHVTLVLHEYLRYIPHGDGTCVKFASWLV